MYELLIQNYIRNLTKEDIINFCNKENVSLTNEELDLAYIYIKKYWKDIIKKDPSNVFNDLKNKIRPTTYNKMLILYEKYKHYKKLL